MELKRYDIRIECYDWDRHKLEIEEEEDGKWVKFKDLKELSLSIDDKNLFTRIMGISMDVFDKPGTLCFCMEELLKFFDITRK